MAFASFTSVTPIPPSTFTRLGPRVPDGVAQAWHDHGTGLVGDGYFRLVDPARAEAMLGTASPLPSDAIILFTTAMADRIAWWNTMFLVAKCRLGEIHATSESFDQLIALMDDQPGYRDVIWDHQPYPQARDRLGVPDFEDCLMHVPLLKMGGRGDADHMHTGSLWTHVGLMTQLTGKPVFTHMLPLPTQD